MICKTTNRPRVPRAARQGCVRNHAAINFSTANVRTIGQDSDIDLLIRELDNIKAGIVAIQETKARAEKIVDWHTGHKVYIGKAERRIGGVGFIVHPDLRQYVDRCKIVSHRLAVISLNINEVSWKCINVYMPTSDYDDEDIDEMYEAIESEMSGHTHVIVLGDFNARTGKGQPGERYIGMYGLGNRNERGHKLTDFAEYNKLYIANTMFRQKDRRLWTWESPKRAHHQIDYILTNDKSSIINCKVIGLTQCDTRSDHRLVRLSMKIGDPSRTRKYARKINKPIQADKARQAIHRITDSEWHAIRTSEYEVLSETLRKVTDDARASDISAPRTRLKANTLELLKERKMKIDKGEDVRFLSKQLRKQVRSDYKEYNERKAIEAAQQMHSIKKARKTTSLHKEGILCMKDENGTIRHSKEEISAIISEFYTNLFASRKDINEIPSHTHEDIPKVMTEEIEVAIKKMQDGKAMGQDRIAIEILKQAPSNVYDIIAHHFDSILRHRSIPSSWKRSTTLLIHKKGDKDNIENYRPICLMSQMAKLFSRVLLNRISKKLEDGNRREQAGFRKGFSTMDNIYVLTQLIERANEYQIPLAILFIDFRKAFDSVEIKAVINALKRHAIPDSYVSLVEELYTYCETEISLTDDSVRVPVKRGVKQGDVLSPTLFSATLESALRDTDICHGININGELLQYLLFADDIVMFAHSPQELEEMVNRLDKTTSKLGLEIHPLKTQWMANELCIGQNNIKLNGIPVQKTEDYIYLGRSVNMKNDMGKELIRRKKSGWYAFSKLRDILTSRKVSREVKAQVFNTHVIPSLTYACETWSLTEREEHFLQVTQRAMERRMTSTRLIQHISNEELRERSKVNDIIDTLYISKRRWAGHVIRRSDNRWATRITEWRPWGYKRPRGRPQTRWCDPMLKLYGRTWTRFARCRSEWRRCDLRRWRDNG